MKVVVELIGETLHIEWEDAEPLEVIGMLETASVFAKQQLFPPRKKNNAHDADNTAVKETSDVPIARLSEKSLEVQLTETDQAIAQLENVRQSLLYALGNRNVREFAKEAVGRRG